MEECKGNSCCFGDSEPLPFYQVAHLIVVGFACFLILRLTRVLVADFRNCCGTNSLRVVSLLHPVPAPTPSLTY
eukprot:3141541-Rhodomonas_salina.1